MARRHARRLFDLCAGFVHSQVLLACVRLRLLEVLQSRLATPAQLARQLALPEPSVARLLEAARALGLVQPRSGGRFGLGPQGAALLGNPALRAMVAHHPLLYADLAEPESLLRAPGTGQLAALWAYARNGGSAALPPGAVAAYSTLMAETQPLVAADVLAAWPFRRHRVLLDVGGGTGAFLESAARAAPRLGLMLFDLPAVAAAAGERLAAAGLAGRAQVHGGDFRRDPLPRGADLATLVRILHDHDDEAAQAALDAVHAALPPGGVLLVAEPMAGVAGSLPATEAYFALYLLAMGQGRLRTPAELAGMLARAGFCGIRLRPAARPWQCAVLAARRS